MESSTVFHGPIVFHFLVCLFYTLLSLNSLYVVYCVSALWNPFIDPVCSFLDICVSDNYEYALAPNQWQCHQVSSQFNFQDFFRDFSNIHRRSLFGK